VVLGLAFFYLGLTLAWQKSKWQARQLLLGSIVYLPLLFGLMVFG
jgi:heme O synthase-like polyprenyltransferase